LVVKELPPVNYVIQKSKKSRPLIAHVDKLKSWVSDNPPKSWLTGEDQQPGLGNVADIGQSGDAGCAVAPTTGSGRTGTNADSEDVVAGRAPGMVNDEARFTEFDGILAPGLGNVADIGESGDAGGAVAPTTGRRGRTGTNGDSRDVASGKTPGTVDKGQSTKIDGLQAHGPGDGGDVREAENVGRAEESTTGTNGHFGGVVEDASTGGCDTGQQGALMMVDLGDNDGDGPGRYTSGPNDGDRPSSYTFGHTGQFEDDVNDGDGLRRYTFSPNNRDEEMARRRATPQRKMPCSDDGMSTTSPEPRRVDDKPKRRDGRTEEETEDTAIAGDPTSTLRRQDRPHRTIRRPARYSE